MDQNVDIVCKFEPQVLLVGSRVRIFKYIKKRPNNTEVSPLPYSLPASHTLHNKRRSSGKNIYIFKSKKKTLHCDQYT